MNSPQLPGASQVTLGDVTEALSVLSIATRWHLTRARWADVGQTATEATAALAIDDGAALRNSMVRIELFGPVRSHSVLESSMPAPSEVLDSLTVLIGALTELDRAGDPGLPYADEQDFPVALAFPASIYLGDGNVHEQVEAAVEEFARAAGLIITDRDNPVLGSWFRRLQARLTGAVQSTTGQDAFADIAHRAELELVLRPEAEVTALLMANVAPLITSLHDSKDAVVRLGAVLVVKHDWALYVNQLTTRQQLVLNHAPHLLTAPDKVLQALGLPQTETVAIPADPS